MSYEVAVRALSAMTYARGGPLGDTPLRPPLRSLSLTPLIFLTDSFCILMSSPSLNTWHGLLKLSIVALPHMGIH